MTNMNAKRRSGLTLIEIIIASLILAAVFGIAMMLLLSSSKHVETQQAAMNLEMEAREVLNQITQDLRQTRLKLPVSSTVALYDGTLKATYGVDDTTTVHTDIEFKMPGLEKKTSQEYMLAIKNDPESLWTRTVRYQWIPETGEVAADGKDNNRNGLIDEGMIRKTETYLDPAGKSVTGTSTICHFVKKDGLTFMAKTGDHGKVEVTLTLEKPDPGSKAGKTFSKTVQSTIELRN